MVLLLVRTVMRPKDIRRTDKTRPEVGESHALRAQYRLWGTARANVNFAT
jgi:hypothetical protein